jgi:propionyl-CoA synthetase
MTRLDDIINTAGHRLSTASMEEVLIQGGRVVEAAVVAKIEELKGEVPVGFVVLKQGEEKGNEAAIKKELVALIRREIGPVASFQHVIIVDKLPKTRSGKILRNVLRKILEAEPYKMPSTIEDESVLVKIE